MHWNIGTPIRLQVILWRGWRGLRWHRWPSPAVRTLLCGSLLLGWVELRFWRRPEKDE